MNYLSMAAVQMMNNNINIIFLMEDKSSINKRFKTFYKNKNKN